MRLSSYTMGRSQPIVDGATSRVSAWRIQSVNRRSQQRNLWCKRSPCQLWLINGIALVLGTGVAILLAQYITKPIQQLARGVNEVVKGNYHQAVTVASQDEIGHLAQRFTEMQGALRAYITSLAEDNNHLEEANTLLEGANTLIKATQDQLVQSERLAAVGQLAAKIAHEVNNPLATMK